MLSLGEAIDALRRPDVAERVSPLCGSGVFAVDLSGEGPPLDAAASHRARRALLRLPCVTAALWREPLSAGALSLLEGFDLALHDASQLDAVTDSVQRAPLASLTLVQLLRTTEALDAERGLLAESWAYSTLQGGPEFARWLEHRGRARARAAGKEPVAVARGDGRLCITLQRPERRNALSAAMRDALCEALQLAVADASITSVELRGAGKDFCSGGDLDEFGTIPDPARAAAVRATRSPARLLAACGPRVHAHIHGACVGAGIELPAFCGRVSASEDTRIRLPELSMGLVPGAGGTVSIPRRIGRQRTAWLALSGATLDAHTALAWGLVDALEGAGES